MNFHRNSLVHFLKQNNVDGFVDMPPASCLRAAHLSAYPAANVERTGRLRTRSSWQIGLAGRWIEIPCIYHVEASDES
jgi:hypothetical protein